jgi:hypothetical protein
MRNRIWAIVAAGVLGVTLIGGPALAQGRGRGGGQCDGTGRRIHQRLRDGSGVCRQGRGQCQGRGNGLRLRDGSGPNPNCPLKTK